MLILFILLTLFGMVMFFWPSGIWLLTESWKSDDATEPSILYIWSIRTGGVICTLAGIGGIYALTVDMSTY
jgi:hypothetical protein